LVEESVRQSLLGFTHQQSHGALGYAEQLFPDGPFSPSRTHL